MSNTLTIRDEEMSGKKVHEFSLDFLTEHITVRELIRSRVYQEVKDHNSQWQQQEFRGLIQPVGSEQTPHGFRMKKPRQLDWQKQFDLALEAFQQHQILILVNDRQIESLEEEIRVATDTDIAFLRADVAGWRLGPIAE